MTQHYCPDCPFPRQAFDLYPICKLCKKAPPPPSRHRLAKLSTFGIISEKVFTIEDYALDCGLNVTAMEPADCFPFRPDSTVDVLTVQVINYKWNGRMDNGYYILEADTRNMFASREEKAKARKFDKIKEIAK